ncbi:MAG: hypothetical protein ACRD4S_11120 [Candidatus Acidiferrales bacterium]
MDAAFQAEMIYYVTGIAITFWAILCCFLFHGDRIDLAAAMGTGLLLWLTVVCGLIRTRRLARSVVASF